MKGVDLAPLRKHRGPVARSESRVGDRRVRRARGWGEAATVRARSRACTAGARSSRRPCAQRAWLRLQPARAAMPWFLGSPSGTLARAAPYALSTIASAFARCSGLPQAGITPTSTSRAAAAMAAAGAARGLRSTFVEVGLVAPFDGVQCVMNGEMHHRHASG